MKIPSIASKIIKIFTVIITIIALYGLLGFVVLPNILIAKLPDIIYQQTGRKAAITNIAFNPFNLRCRLQDFKMQEKNGSAFISFKSFTTKINAWQSITLKYLAIEEVTLTQPFVHVARLKNNDFNFANMSKGKPDKKKSDGKIFPINISKIAIVDGKLFWEDYHLDKSVQEKMTPINLSIDNFTTNADKQSKLGITLALMSGGKLDWKGKIGVNPITSHGHISLDNIKLPTLLALAAPNKPAFDLHGTERFSADYTLDYSKDGLKLSLSKAKLALIDVAFTKQQPSPIAIAIPSFTLAADIVVDQAKNRFKLTADKFKVAIQDFQFEQKTKQPVLLKTLDITHEANIALSFVDKTLQFTSSKDKLEVRELYFEQQGIAGSVIKIPLLVHKADIKLNKTDKALQISTDKTRLDVRDFSFKQKGDNSKFIEIPSLSHQADMQFNQTGQDLQISANKTTLDISNLDFKDNGDNKMLLTIPSLRHETDIKVSQNDKGLQVSANKTKLDIKNIDFKRSGNNKMLVKIPRFSHETDMQFNLADKIWQITTHNSKLSSGNIQLSGMDLAPIMLKIPELALETAYKTDNKDNTLSFVASKGKFDLQKLQLDDTEHNTTLAKVDAFGFNGLDVNLKNKELLLASVSAKNADFKAWLNADKTINYQTLFSAPKPSTSHHLTKPVVTRNKAADSAWKVKVSKLALTNFGLDFEDRTLAKPIAMTARPIDLQMKNFTTKTGAALPVQLSVGINKSGLLKIAGTTTLEPFATQLAVTVNNLALEKYQPYLDKFARLDIIQGNLNIDGKLAVAKKTKDMDVKFKGNTSVVDLVTRDQILNKDFVKWDKVSVNDIDADVLANRYTAAALIMNKPYARVTIRKDKTINVNDIMVPKDKALPASNSKVSSAKATTTASKKTYFKLNTVKIIDGASDFSDLSLLIPFFAPIKELNGGANDISSEQNSKITVVLVGNTFELSPVKIKGSVSPYLGNFDIDMNFDGMPMPLVSPYMVQFAGYKVEKGKLSLGLKYAIEKKQLTASNSILIDQLELGEKVENPDAVSLPLELAVTLLKDSDGKIKIDVPLTGSLEDPQFSIGSIIGDALFNVLTKIITSPFKFIAGLANSDADLSVINFTAGASVLSAEQIQKLDDIAKALKDRPALNIEVKGAAFQEQDWPVLRDEALHEQLQRLKAGEINKDNDKKVRSEYVYLSADDYNRLLVDVFIMQYPKLAKKSLFGKPILIGNEEGDFYAFAKKKMSETLVPDLKRLNDLATDRAGAIAKHLVQKAGIPNERIFILDTVVDPERTGKDITSQLSLKTN